MQWLLEIEDITPLDRAQHSHVQTGRTDLLVTPRETVFLPRALEVARRLGLDVARG